MANNERQFESFSPPVFTCDGHFVKAIFARPLPTTQKTTQKAIQKTIQKKVKGSENGRGYVETTEAVIDVIRAKHTVTISEMAYILGMSVDGIKYQLKVLAARGRIRRVGGRKQGYWALPFEEPDSNDAASEREAKSVVKSVVKTREKSVVKSVVKNTDQILAYLKENPSATRQQLAAKTGLTIRGVERNLKVLKNAGRIRRVGPAKGGHWEVVNGQ